jgi:hypothetical protein
MVEDNVRSCFSVVNQLVDNRERVGRRLASPNGGPRQRGADETVAIALVALARYLAAIDLR